LLHSLCKHLPSLQMEYFHQELRDRFTSLKSDLSSRVDTLAAAEASLSSLRAHVSDLAAMGEERGRALAAGGQRAAEAEAALAQMRREKSDAVVQVQYISISLRK
jgi:peptidoglycan hydrolase CwlO-like protein